MEPAITLVCAEQSDYRIGLDKLIKAARRRMIDLNMFKLEDNCEKCAEIREELNRYAYEKYESIEIGKRFDEYSISKDLLFNFEKYPTLSAIYTCNVLANDFESIKKIEKKVSDTILSKGFIKKDSFGFKYIEKYDFNGRMRRYSRNSLKSFYTDILPEFKKQFVSEELAQVIILPMKELNAKPIDDNTEELLSKRKVMQLNDRTIINKIDKEPIFVDVEEDSLCIAYGVNTIHYKVVVIPKSYAPIKEYCLELTYKFLPCDRLQFVRDIRNTRLDKNEIIDFPINVIQMKVFDFKYIDK